MSQFNIGTRASWQHERYEALPCIIVGGCRRRSHIVVPNGLGGYLVLSVPDSELYSRMFPTREEPVLHRAAIEIIASGGLAEPDRSRGLRIWLAMLAVTILLVWPIASTQRESTVAYLGVFACAFVGFAIGWRRPRTETATVLCGTDESRR